MHSREQTALDFLEENTTPRTSDTVSQPTVRRRLTLSASRASDFRQCPLRYRLRAIDNIPEPTSAAQLRGLVVHDVLEHLFTIPADRRVPPEAYRLIKQAFEQQKNSRGAGVIPLEEERNFLNTCAQLINTYFHMEDPRRFMPLYRECECRVEIEDKVPLHGFIDRVDKSPTGLIRITDYKTGKRPAPRFQQGAEYQVRLYALMFWKLYDIIPAAAQLIYLGTGNTLTRELTQRDLERCEEESVELWNGIRQRGITGDFETSTSALCAYCHLQQFCPEYGGTPPPYPGWPGEYRTSTDDTTSAQTPELRGLQFRGGHPSGS